MKIAKTMRKILWSLLAAGAVCLPAQAGLIFYAPFENDDVNTAGAIVHDGAGSLNGVVNDGRVQTAAAKIGSKGYQAAGDWWATGATGSAAGSVGLPSGDNAWTFSFWYRMNGDDYSQGLIRWGTGNNYQNVGVWGSVSGSFMGDFVINHAADASAWANSSTTPPVAGIDDGFPAPTFSSWHHIVGTYTGSQGTEKLYIDGAERDSISRAGYALNIVNNLTTPWRIGMEFGGGSYLDDVAIWNTALTGAQVTELYNGGTGKAANLIPEPSTLSLVGLILAGFVIRRRRK